MDDLDDQDDQGDSLYARMLRRTRRIIQLLEPAFKEKILVWNGHHKNGEYFYSGNWWATPEQRLRSMFDDLHTITISKEDFQRMEEASATGGLLHPPVMFKFLAREFSCTFCDQRLSLGYDGQRLLVVDEPCPHPDGLVTEWELNVPSGKLAIANDLRQWFPGLEDYSANALLDRHLTTLAYAKVGMSHGYVGNTCPGVYQDGDTFVIGSYSEDPPDDDEDDEDDEGEVAPCPWGKEVASVCTDLWWYSMVDHAELLRRRDHYTPGVKIDEHRINVIDVKPGVYQFRQVVGVNHHVSNVVYATFKWVREPDPLVDYVGREKARNLNALEVLIESCLSWPTLFMGLGYSTEDDKLARDRSAMVKRWEGLTQEHKVSYLACAANHFMCTGGVLGWHENGFPRTTVGDDAKRLAKAMDTSRGGSWRGWHLNPEMEGVVPLFGKKRRHWSPISPGYGGLCLGAGVLNEYTKDTPLLDLAPGFVLLGLNICQSAIRGGEEPRLNHGVWPPAYEIPFCRERMKLFGRCYQGLRERYPTLVFNAAFDRWMRKVDFDKYVDDFNFGPANPPEETWGSPPVTVKQGDYFELDANQLKDGSFCWHPKYMAGWAAKKNAQRYTLRILAETQSPMGHLHDTHDSGCQGPATVPLRVVGRVIRGTGEGYSCKTLEVAFDYGTPDMCSQRWGISKGDMSAVRQFSDPQEYQALLEVCRPNSSWRRRGSTRWRTPRVKPPQSLDQRGRPNSFSSSSNCATALCLRLPRLRGDGPIDAASSRSSSLGTGMGLARRYRSAIRCRLDILNHLLRGSNAAKFFRRYAWTTLIADGFASSKVEALSVVGDLEKP